MQFSSSLLSFKHQDEMVIFLYFLLAATDGAAVDPEIVWNKRTKRLQYMEKAWHEVSCNRINFEQQWYQNENKNPEQAIYPYRSSSHGASS